MEERDDNYKLSGKIEIDEAFFGATHEGRKPDRCTEKTPLIFGLSHNKKENPLFLHAKNNEYCRQKRNRNIRKFAD
ncbi:hypothetical protein FACS1894105_01570 [Clostridia bacterium]|nr:hypothetical protein FACS1894105_01420 [Clostridia bacterium]GHU34562.1 hypothetical protein FACS1894105_01570 [Clostridia bacterium]